GVPLLKVYDIKAEKMEKLSVEEYLPAVLAGEMAGDWPLEALKAQAILARTFVLQFVSEKESRYEGADISTDIEEAQAYNADAINDRIRQAVRETRGLVLNAGGELPYAWFHAHSGGLTARAKEGLDYEKDEPGYTQCVKGMEDDEAPAEAARWQAAFTMDEVIAAARDAGAVISKVTGISVGQRGESGRATTLIISGKEVSAPAFRIAIGSTKMRSCLLESLKVEDNQVKMAGKGYGHGVGMSQWGAYAMAKQGRNAEEIVTHYFAGVTLDQAWE
ncbi:MAG: SpoIID/LytB domain-containing protein, partial [Clostridia bacterium]|nr:SpoIID/LytB domain-containing protein [Clostridia bacterium]